MLFGCCSLLSSFGMSVHYLTFLLVHFFYLCLCEKLGILFVISLTDIEDFLAHGKALLDALLFLLLG